MLPSALPTASAPAITHFRASIAHPTRLLCTLRLRCLHRRRNTHYQAGVTPYLGRTCTGWIPPASPRTPTDIVAAGEFRKCRALCTTLAGHGRQPETQQQLPAVPACLIYDNVLYQTAVTALLRHRAYFFRISARSDA